MGRVAREIISFGPTQPDANGRSMKSLDRCVQQELGKSGRNEDSSPRASAGVGKLTEDLGKREGEERGGVYAVAVPGMLTLNVRQLCL